jgi:hypothetical protein
MKFLVTALVALALMASAAGAAVRSGLKGLVLIEPAFPVCRVGQPCTKPARYVTITFSRRGRVVASTRTGSDGSYRITLKPGTYVVAAPKQRAGSGLLPRRVAVRSGLYRRVVFKLDIGIQ